MKIIHAILIFILSCSKQNFIFIDTKNNLLTSLKNQQTEFWMVGALSDSFENQILLTMAEMPRWKEVLKDWEVPSVRDYKKILEKHGFSISHSEIHREVVCSHLANYIPKLPLDVAEEADFQNEFCKQAQNCPLIYKQLLIRIGS